MSRKLTILTGALILALPLIGTARVSALSTDYSPLLSSNNEFNISVLFPQLQPAGPVAIQQTKPKPPEPKPPEAPKPVEYSVVSGDNLTKIAEAHGTTWLRLWQKNTKLDNPDLIFPGQVFLIPDPNEQLADRPVPAAVVAALAPQTATRGPATGNTYDAGYCTWYVKNRRPDLPNGLGNANTWYSRAAGMGLPHGSTPRAGAVGTTTAGDYGHVVYVELVNSDGSIVISEMNYAGLYSQRTRTASASEFLYIY